MSKLFVLVDDDFLVHMTWKMIAEKTGVRLLTFLSEEELSKNLHEIDNDANFYIDKKLANSVDGIEVARNLSEKGFTNIYLATGSDYLLEGIETRYPFIKGVIGKSPPF